MDLKIYYSSNLLVKSLCVITGFSGRGQCVKPVDVVSGCGQWVTVVLVTW